MGSISQSDYVSMLARTQPKRKPAISIAPSAKNEGGIHNDILAECKRRGWIALHGRMDTATGRTLGEWDLTVLADGGRVFFVEIKTATGKLRPEQAGMIAWAAKLGHSVHVVRSLEEFLSVVK